MVILKKYIAILLSLVMASSFSGCFLLPEEPVSPELPLVTPYSGEEYLTADVTRGDIRLVREVKFTYQATRRETLRFDITGKSFGVVQVAVGDMVEAGQLVAWLDVSDVEQRLAVVDAEIARLRILLAEAEEACRLAEEAEKLQGGGTVSSEARAADAAYYSASLALQEGKRAELVAELESLRLYATISGTVTYAKPLFDGAVSNKSDSVVTITDTSSSVFTATTEHYGLFPVGEEMTVLADGAEYTCLVRDPAQLGMQASALDIEQGKQIVCLEVQGAETPAGSDVRGTVTLEIDSRENVLMLPLRAVFTVEDSYYVYYEDESGLKSAKEIQCGLANDRWIEVISGLEEGDSVILR